jgi:peptidoglycan/LPS O-acetylase OafA/YrhL
MYYLGLIVSLVVAGVGPRYWLGDLQGVSILNIIFHVLFLHGFVPFYADSIIGTEWYLGALAIIYLLGPIMYKFINSLERACVFFILSGVISLEMVTLFKTINPNCIAGYVWDSYCEVFVFFAHLPEIAMGILLYFLIKEFGLRLANVTNKNLVSFSMIFIAVLLFYGNSHNNAYRMSNYVWYAIIFAMLLISQIIKPCLLINNSLWRNLGIHSYSIYLFHYPILTLWKKILPKFYVAIGIQDSVIQWIGTFLLSFITAYLIGIFIEIAYDKPIKQILKKYLKNYYLSYEGSKDS